LTDSNRLVRLRAAEGLLQFKAELVPTFERVVALHDRYGLHAFLMALDNAGLKASLVSRISQRTRSTRDADESLLEALETGKLSTELGASQNNILVKGASQS
jgi:hypothetical protein